MIAWLVLLASPAVAYYWGYRLGRRHGIDVGHIEARTALVLEQIHFMHQLTETMEPRGVVDKRAVN